MKTKAQKIVVAVTAIIVAGLVCATLIIAFGGEAASIVQDDNDIVNTATVTLGDMERSITGKGSVGAGETLGIEMPIDGEIDEVLLRTGEAVSAGDALAALNVEDLRSQLDALLPEYDGLIEQISDTAADTQTITVRAPMDGVVGERHLSRGEQVVDIKDEFGSLLTITGDDGQVVVIGEDVPAGSIRSIYVRNGESVEFGERLFKVRADTDTLAIAYADLEEVKQDIKQLESLIDDPFIYATAGGYAGDIANADFIGMQAVQGQKLFDVIDLDGYTVGITVDEQSIHDVYIGQQAQVTLDSGIALFASVSYINHVGDGGDFTVEVSISGSEEIASGAVLIGEVADVSIFIERKEDTLKVPIGAIFEDSKGEYVMVFTGDMDISMYEETDIPTEKRYIERGMVSELYVEILSGVSEGERVIIVISSNEQGATGGGDEGKGGGALRLLK